MNHDNPSPSGGLRVIYEHVRHLTNNGYRAAVVHLQQGFKPSWFQDDVQVLYYDSELNLQPDDLIILPEDHAGFLELFRAAPLHKILFCQNHFYLFEGLKSGDTLQSLGISAVMACSDVVSGFLRANLAAPVIQTVHCAISSLFAPASNKKLQIAYMPRKRPLEAQFIRSLCTRILGPAIPLEWVALDGVSQAVVAQTLAESAIFLSLSRLEGFGLPPLEAMASGCLVVGFTGFGGMEYATQENGFWCGEDDLTTCAHTLAAAVQMVQGNASLVENIISAARKTAAAYTAQRQEQELLQALHCFINEAQVMS